MREPGGFRRQHLSTQAEARGVPIKDRPKEWDTTLLEQKYTGASFAACLSFPPFDQKDDAGLKEGLLHQPKVAAKLSDIGCAIAILKGNCGPASLPLAKAWSHGGVLVATPTYFILSTIATVCVAKLLAVHTKNKKLGDMVADSAGPVGRVALDVSIVLLQSGVCVAYITMVGDLVHLQFFPQMTKVQLILWELLIFFPLACIRSMQHLWLTNLIGTFCVLSGFLLSIFIAISTASSDGRWDEVRATPEDTAGFLTFLGTATFSFEGIGLVIPIYESIQNPHRFVGIYALIYFVLNILNSTLAVSGYGAYGSSVDAMVLHNFPSGGLVLYVRCAYAVNMLCTFPLMLLPAIRLVEGRFFESATNPPLSRKMKKNLFRGLYVCLMGGLAIVGSTSLDHLISLIGAMAGIPVAFIVPTLCHWALSEELTFGQRLFDFFCLVLGAVLAVVVTATNVTSWISGT